MSARPATVSIRSTRKLFNTKFHFIYSKGVYQISFSFSKKVNAEWLNADKIRGKYNDWDFSKKGIIRQVERMKNLAQQSQKNIVCFCQYRQIVDFFLIRYLLT